MNEIEEIEKTASDVEKSSFEKTIIQISRSLDIIAVTVKKRWGTILVIAIGLFIYWAFNLESATTVNHSIDEYSEFQEYNEVSTPYNGEIELNGYTFYTGDTIWYDETLEFEIVK